MNAEFKVVYPAPPPTSNALTPHQRTQLVRRARKIEQILGVAPQLLDSSIKSTSPVHVISLPYSLPQTQPSPTKTRRSSIDSISSSESSSVSFSSVSVSRSPSTSSTFSTTSARKLRRLHTTNTFSWAHPSEEKPKLTIRSPNLETIPASPQATDTSFLSFSEPNTPSLSWSNSVTAMAKVDTDPFALIATETSSPRSSIVLTQPQFIIPSQNSIRKQKMDRLRKKLGSGVPLNLVFPNENDSDSSSSENTPADQEKRSSTVSSFTPRPRTPKKRIAASRNSLELDSVHRARRQVVQARIVSPPPSFYASSSPALDHRNKDLPAVPQTDFRRLKEKLSLIIESPDEHGAGCIEEFGITRIADITANSQQLNKTEVRLWSTRKGYEGWDLKSDISVSLYSSSFDDDRSAPVTPLTPSPNTESSSYPSSPNTFEFKKKRPLSYRKPAPPIPTDCC